MMAICRQFPVSCRYIAGNFPAGDWERRTVRKTPHFREGCALNFRHYRILCVIERVCEFKSDSRDNRRQSTYGTGHGHSDTSTSDLELFLESMKSAMVHWRFLLADEIFCA